MRRIIKVYQQYNEETKRLAKEIERFDATADKYDDKALIEGNKELKQFLFYRTNTNITKGPHYWQLLGIAFEIWVIFFGVTIILRYM